MLFVYYKMMRPNKALKPVINYKTKVFFKDIYGYEDVKV